MDTSIAAIVRYEAPFDSVGKAVDLSGGLDHLPSGAKVFIKPNIVFWTRSVSFPKWGVITTSRVVHDMVHLLKERGIDDITIGEGTVVYDPKDYATVAHAYETLGYNVLKQRYGVKCINVFERPFEKVDLGDGIELNFNTDILQSDFLVNIPVLKTHVQTVVSLGIKNVKGLLDVKSRKRCHSFHEGKDLHFMVSKLVDKMPPSFTLIDGIYANERGPGFDGTIKRSNILIASRDVLSADKVGSVILGYKPSQVPHLVHASAKAGRTDDLSDLEVVGENIQEMVMDLDYRLQYNEDGTLPIRMAQKGIQGVSCPEYDLTLCTYCWVLLSAVRAAISFAWKGQPWDDVEILTGKLMQPTPGRNHTILLGKCMYEANRNHPDIRNLIAVKTCPPSPKDMVSALRQAGIDVESTVLEHMDKAPALLMKRYADKPEFEESFFRIV